jgi:hypothetical protein
MIGVKRREKVQVLDTKRATTIPVISLNPSPQRLLRRGRVL